MSIPVRPLQIRGERFPYACQWELTCRCNLRCVMCYTDCFNTPEKIKQELSTAEILRIMDEIAEAGCFELGLTGGEPMARPDFFEIYEHAKCRGFLIALFTNGTLLNERTADRLAAMPPERVEISLHGIEKQTFEAVTQGKGSFEKCLKGIRLLVERRIPLVLKTAAMNLNRDEILRIKAFARSLKGTSYKLGERMRLDLAGDSFPKKYELSRRELAVIEEADPEIRQELCHPSEEEGWPCLSGHRSFHIDAYGVLQLCSGNRRMGYDLRRGSFKEGFYQAMPSFPCPLKTADTKRLQEALQQL